ncbi:unnamed protein product [Oppiella nova]|nr:unnamed protein product [Oppiella nova]CAG2177824.1 unnamed protein product [Oppiella nova]
MPIILFNPERPHIMHKEVIIYLRIKYGSESKVKTKFLRIFNVLHDIQKLQELHRQNFKIISPDKYGPLLKEILDVPATYTALCA